MDASSEQLARLVRIRYVANLMDARFRFLGIRFGLDSLIGLVPGIGDIIAGLVAVYIIWEAYRIGIPEDKIREMILRTLVDLFIGGIPLIGDLFDVFYKANVRNVRTIEEYFETNR